MWPKMALLSKVLLQPVASEGQDHLNGDNPHSVPFGSRAYSEGTFFFLNRFNLINLIQSCLAQVDYKADVFSGNAVMLKGPCGQEAAMEKKCVSHQSRGLI